MVPICGLAGFSLAQDEVVDARVLARALLLGIEERGRHATGIGFFAGAQALVMKDKMPASRFVEHLDQMGPNTRTAILHTRWASQGSPDNNENNHPIDVGGVLGVHNGVLANDDELFDRVGADLRLAEVDSEAIFATLLFGGEPVPQALARVRGSAAIAWLETDGDPEVLHVARLAASPLIYAFTAAGSFLCASTDAALHRAVTAAGLRLTGGPHTAPEGTYLKIRAGQVVARHTFQAARGPAAALTGTERRALNLT